MPTLPANPLPPSVTLQVLMLTLIFAIGLAGGWVVWGRKGKVPGTSAEVPAGTGPRRIVLGTGGGAGRASPGASRGAPSASLNRIFQALTIVDDDARFVALVGALGEMKAEDALPAQERLKEEYQPEKGPNREREALYRHWGEADPAGAIAFAKTFSEEKAQGYVLKLMVEGWARNDPAAAGKWLDGWPTAPDWEGVCAGFIKGLASKDPWMAAQTAIASIPEASNVKTNWLRDAMVNTLAEAMARQGGVEQLQRWFASIPGGTPAEQKFKQKAMHTVAQHLEHRDPEAAKRWLETQPGEPWRSGPAYVLVAKALAKTDRAAALNWLASLPTGATPVGMEAGREIYQGWLAEKPEEVNQWARAATNENFLREISEGKRKPKLP